MKKTTFLFKTLFLFVLTATFSSCSSDDDSSEPSVEPENSSITISSNTANLTSSSEEAFTFTVKDDEGNDVTNESTVYVNDNALDGNTFSSTEIGSYDAYAKMDDLTSNTISVSISEDPVAYYKHKVLVEDFTGTWCGWCPRIAYSIEQALEMNENLVIASLHRGNPNGGGSYDPFNFAPAAQLEQQIGLEGYPTATINRTIFWDYPEDVNVDQPVNLIQDSSIYGIAIDSDLGASNGTVTVNFEFAEAPASGLKYVVYIAEDGLIQDQVNYTDRFGGSSVLQDFTHDHVIRALGTESIMGTAIPAENAVEGGTYEASMDVSYTSENIDNLKVIVFLVDEDGTSLNAQQADANTELDFDVVE